MVNRGRVPAAAMAVSPAFSPTETWLDTPESLSEPAKRVFSDLVASCDAKHFEASDIGLLAQYCEAQVMAERAAAQLQTAGTPETKWLALWEKSTRTMSGLALRLRLSPQARREKAQAPRQFDWSTRFGMGER